MKSRALTLALIVLCLAGGAVDVTGAAEPARDRLDRFLGDLRTLEARFRQVLLDEQGEPVEEASGVVFLARPDRFRWDYREPYRQLIVADGEQLWLYDPDLEQVTLRPQGGALDATPAALLSSARALEESFQVTELGEDTSGTAWLGLVPLESVGSFEGIRIGFDAEGLRGMELKDGFGQTTRLEFTAVRRNPDLDGTLFRFTPPAGVDVIRGQ